MFELIKIMLTKEESTQATRDLVEVIKRDESVRVVGRGTVVRDAESLTQSRDYQEMSEKLANLVQ